MKKPSSVAFLITFLLAAAVCTQGQEQELIKDTDGNPLETAKQYFIQPIKTKSNNGGGLVPAAIKILPFCPLGITQTLLPTQPGLPVSFSSPYDPTETIVKAQAPLNIKFESDIWLCQEFSKLWKVDDSSSAAKEPVILIGGNEEDGNSLFQIEKAGDGANTYKLTPSLGGTVGTIPGPWLGAPQLVVTDDAAKTLLVNFKRVEDTTTYYM